MKASDLLRDRRDLQDILDRQPSSIVRLSLTAAVGAIDNLLLSAGVTPPGRDPTDHALRGLVAPRLRAEPEKVWVLIDGVGQPCLRHLRHRSGSQGERQPVHPEGLDASSAPFEWVAYDLLPVRGRT